MEVDGMAGRDAVVVVQKGDHSLGYYDFHTGEEIGRVEVDPYPHEFTISPDRRLAYLAHFGVALAEHEGAGGNTVSVVDLQARRRIGTIQTGDYRRPHDVALDGQGALYILSEGTGNLLVVKEPRSGRIDHVLPTRGRGSHMVSVTGDGRLAFCSNMESGTVTAVFPSDPERPGVVMAVGRHPEGSVFDEAEERLFVVNRESAEISIVDVKRLGVRQSFATPPGPVRICHDRQAGLLVALYHASGLAIIDPNQPSRQRVVSLPAKAISVGYHPATQTALLSTHSHEVCLVDVKEGRLVRSIRTRSDPDPLSVISLAA
jgi:DNA-binding beta-propeller fold protein YncE